jgi:iron complex outermembrane receptor protein
MFGISLDADRDTISGFFELRAPLISPEQDSPLGRRLVVTASGRYDRYSDFGGTFNPRVAIVWEPTRSLLLRGAYGSSFRAPSLFELYLPPTFIPGIPVQDPRRGNEVSIVDLSLSGNPDLDPEDARSLTAGILFAPEGAAGLRLGATYWSIEQDQRVVRTNPFLVLANESFFPELVERAAPTPTDVAAGRPGRLLGIDAPNINSGRAETSGIDFEASLGIATDFGRFAPSLRVTWVHRYKAADYPFSPTTDRVGLAQVTGTIPDVTAVATLAWSHQGLGASLTGRYISPYDDVDSFGGLNGREVEPPLLIDLQLSADLGEIASARLLDGLILRAGAINLFDDGPAFTEVNGAYGYDTSQFDIRGRFLYFTISKAF